MSEFQDYLKRMSVLDYLHLSESGRTPEEIAEGDIYSTSEIEETCHELLGEGLISKIGSEKYVSNNSTERWLEDDTFDRIRRAYERYLKEFAEIGAFSMGGDDESDASPYPLKSSIAAKPESFRANYFGDVRVGIEDKFFLTENNSLPAITDLSTRNLERLPILLTKVLWVSISDENIEYWKFTYDVFNILYEEASSEMASLNHTIRILFQLILSSLSIFPRYRFSGHSKTGEDFSHEVLRDTEFIAAFVAYPALEAFLKFQCRSDIDLDGSVKEARTIRDFSPYNDRDFYDKGDMCSSIRDLLIHFEQEVADDELQKELEQLRGEIGELADHPKSRVYGLIYQWRNTLSHEGATDVKFGVITNLICMIIWHDANTRLNSGPN